MSSILEALKKSEAQRAAGHARPAPMPHAAQRGPTQNRLLLFLTPLAIGLAIAVAWRYGLLPSSGQVDPVAAPVPAGTPLATGGPAPAADASPVPAAPGTETRSSAAPAAASSEPITKPVAAATTAAEPASTAQPRSVAAPAEATVQDDEDTTAPLAAPTDVPAPTPAAEAAVRESEETRDAPPPKPGSRLPSLAQLPALEKEIGAVEMTMLVYSQDPARRFALVNGQRLKEGDTLDGGIELLEIRRDSCVFAASGQRFVIRSQ